ncbi:MAG TPA: PD-(D/E)XK nuclease family protein [Gemmatimonadaceae bacterium]|nr:PD-(D/E)XK nuclease family protein [Gemmatimonadaceae bacterium]
MAAAVVTRIVEKNPALLLERAADGLFPLAPATREHPWPTLGAWLVLRQGGLRDDFYRLAAARGVAGWFDPSICLFTELRTRWGAPSAMLPLTEPERHAILARLLDERGRAVFGRGAVTDAWVPAVDKLIGEFVSEGISTAAFTTAMRATADDAHARDRAESLASVLEGWETTLASSGRIDGRDSKVRLAREIAADPSAFAARLGGRREIRIVGLADLRGGWRQLLEALVASPVLDRVEVLTTAALDLPAGFSQDSTTVGETTVVDEVVGTTVLWQAPDTAREAELVAVRVRALIDEGAEPARIAVIARQARPAVDTMANALAQIGVPVTARRRDALVETTPARALLAILTAARERWSRHSVAELAEHPLLRKGTGLDAGIVNTVGYSRAVSSRAGWREGFRELLQRCESREREEDEPESRRDTLPPSARVRDALAAWDAIDSRLGALDEPRVLADWCAWAHGALQDPGWGIAAALAEPCVDAAVWRSELRARDEIAAIIHAWREALGTFGAPALPMDADRFLDRLTLMLSQDVVTPPTTDFGVVVAEALAAGWRSFDHVFVVGLTAGEFPRRPVPGQVFDAGEREALIAAGLPLDAPDAWRERERELFRVLAAGARKTLTLSWPAMDAEGREVARSAFVDEAAAELALSLGLAKDDSEDEALERAGALVRFPSHEALVHGFPVARDDAAIARAHVAAAREHDRFARALAGTRAAALSPWNGIIGDPALVTWLGSRFDESYEWSATQLEQAAKCRWHWFASRLLGLDTLTDADDQLEPTVSGALRHDALDRFFARARALRGPDIPVQLVNRDLAEWAFDLMREALDAAWEAAEAKGLWLGPPVLHGVARAEMLRDLEEYLRFEAKYNEDGTNNRTSASKIVRGGAIEGEFKFNDIELSGAGVTFRLRGSIDRIDRGVDERITGADRYIAAIDYKSSKYSTPAAGKAKAWDDGIVLQVPLYAAALEKMRPGSTVARMEYRTLRRPEIVHQLSLHPVKAGEVQDAPEARAKLSAALDAAGRLITELRTGQLPALPAPSAGCPPFCPARDICRIPGGPVEVK